MKTFVSGILGLFLFSNVSFAAVHDSQIDLELEAMALLQVMETQAAAGPEIQPLGAVGDFFKNLLKNIEDIKGQILDQFDENGNGRIDPGPELDNFKQTIKDVVLLLADSNANGHIDLEDIGVLTNTLVDQLKEKAKEQLCPAVIKEAESAGWWLRFRPVLNHFYQVCTFGA